jgi:hypothetical protein
VQRFLQDGVVPQRHPSPGDLPLRVPAQHTDRVVDAPRSRVGDRGTTAGVPRVPAALVAQARPLTAFQRGRGLATPDDRLRAVLASVLGALGVRRLGAWAVLIGRADLSEAAWRKRLRTCNPWLLWVPSEVIAVPATPGGPSAQPQGRIRLVAASPLRQPGGTGDAWRLQLADDFTAMRPNAAPCGAHPSSKTPAL